MDVVTFREQVAAALDTNDAGEARHRVHAVVADEVRRLDPEVTATVTDYFNHSYAPDLVLTYRESGVKREREIFLRHSLRSSRAAGDLETMSRAEESTWFLSLSLDDPEGDAQTARRAVPARSPSRALVTTVPALDDLTAVEAQRDPVLNVVRASIVRSAKGILVEDDVKDLVLPRDRRLEGDDFDRFNRVVANNFTEDAVFRINRMSSIVQQAVAGEDGPVEVLGSGSLSATEIRELVPYLLELEGVTQSRDFWLSIASMITLDEFERLWESLADLDLTPLASAASTMWRASRAQLNIRAESIDNPEFQSTPRWGFTGRALSADVGNWRIVYALTATKLRTSGRRLSPARWVDLRPALANYTVVGADLAGVVTTSTYGAREGADMKGRIDAFIENADDSFHIPEVTVETGTGDDRASITADFSEMMLRASPSASLATMTRAALQILGYRYPPRAEDVAYLLEGPSDDPEEGEMPAPDPDDLP